MKPPRRKGFQKMININFVNLAANIFPAKPSSTPNKTVENGNYTGLPSSKEYTIMNTQVKTKPFFLKHKNALAVTASVAILGGLYYGTTRDPVSPVTVEHFPNTYAIIIDNSDPLTPTQDKLLDELIQRLPAKFQANDRIMIIDMTENSRDPVRYSLTLNYPNFSQGLDRARIDASILEERDKAQLKAFSEQLMEAFNAARSPTPKNKSPIFETLKTVGGYLKNQDNTTALHLIYVSDWLQNAGGCSHYIDVSSKACKNLASNIDLEGIQVEAIYLSRSSQFSYQTHSHRQEVERIFNTAKADSVSFREW